MSERVAFVIMPFGEEFDRIFKGLIEPPLSEAGYQVRRADTDDNPQSIIKEIIQGIYKADLVVADLSELNPNVMYELARTIYGAPNAPQFEAA
jgi:hypothetical protein